MKTTIKLFTRKNYMNNECTQQEYYSQFVTNHMKDVILSTFSKDQLIKKYEKDEHLNNIPLKWWDSFENIFKQHIASINKKINGQSVWSSATHTCAMKAAARDIIESNI